MSDVGTFRLIQIGAVLGYLLFFGAPIAVLFVFQGAAAIGPAIVGGTLVGLGAMLCGTSAGRIYAPEREVTVGVYESGYERRDGESVHVQRQVGTAAVTYTRQQAVRMTRNSLVFGLAGVVLAWGAAAWL